jgi:sugar phosphate isomerase/epimerase
LKFDYNIRKATGMEFCIEPELSLLYDDAKLEGLKRQGVSYISVPYDFIEETPREKLRERAGAFASFGITVDNAHPRFGSYNTENSLVNQYRTPRLRYLEQLKEGLDRMSILGVRTAPLHTGGGCQPESPEWTLELCAESIFEITRAAVDAGIVLALENTFFNKPNKWDGVGSSDGRPEQTTDYIYDDIGKLCRLIDILDSPYVKGCFDAGHSHYLGCMARDFSRMADNIALYHLHDNNRAYDMHLPPGYGTLD